MSDDDSLSFLDSLGSLESPASNSFINSLKSPDSILDDENNERRGSKRKRAKRVKSRKNKVVVTEDDLIAELDAYDNEKPTNTLPKRSLRPRKETKYATGDEFENGYDDDDDDYSDFDDRHGKRRRKGAKKSYTRGESKPKEPEALDEDIYEDNENGDLIEEQLNKIPKNKKQLQKLYETINDRLGFYKSKFINENVELQVKKSSIAEDAIPINADVRTFDWKKFCDAQVKFGGRPFDVIMMDPPWHLSSSQPSRGVAIAYSSLSDELIQKIPVPKLQTDGFIFVWTINAKYAMAVKMMEKWGYKLVDEITWIKKTINGKIAKGHGFYLQHAKESCLVGVKGNTDRARKNIGSDIIFSERRGQSQKPEEIYELIEKLVPNGYYLEIFGRRNNVRSKWVTIGNEI